jgi:peroxiredoxin
MAKKVRINTTAPDFDLQDFRGRAVRLGDYRGVKHVVLVFNRGFM